MKDIEKYRIAKEVIDEFGNELYGQTIFDFIEEKLKPVDPLKEKFLLLLRGFDEEEWNEVEGFSSFQRIFKDDLNGTRGLKMLYDYMVKKSVKGDSGINVVWRDIVSKIGEIEKELEDADKRYQEAKK